MSGLWIWKMLYLFSVYTWCKMLLFLSCFQFLKNVFISQLRSLHCASVSWEKGKFSWRKYCTLRCSNNFAKNREEKIVEVRWEAQIDENLFADPRDRPHPAHPDHHPTSQRITPGPSKNQADKLQYATTLECRLLQTPYQTSQHQSNKHLYKVTTTCTQRPRTTT
jgi:hypothetical protein